MKRSQTSEIQICVSDNQLSYDTMPESGNAGIFWGEKKLKIVLAPSSSHIW